MGGGTAVSCVRIRIAGLSLLALLVACAPAGPQGGSLPRLTAADMDPALGYEPAPTLRVSELFPPEVVASRHHGVREEVASDGFFRIYVIDSDFGRFEAAGDIELRQRVQEIRALAALKELREVDDDHRLARSMERILSAARELLRGLSDR